MILSVCAEARCTISISGFIHAFITLYPLYSVTRRMQEDGKHGLADVSEEKNELDTAAG